MIFNQTNQNAGDVINAPRKRWREKSVELLNALDKFCKTCGVFECGLPTWDDGKVAQMVDIIEDWLDQPLDNGVPSADNPNN